MNSAIEKLGEDDDGQPMQSTRPPRKCAKRPASTANQYSALDIEEASDADDHDFSDEIPALQSGSDSESDSDADEQMTNEEVFSNAYTCSIIAHAIFFSSSLPFCRERQWPNVVLLLAPSVPKRTVCVSEVVHQPLLPLSFLFNPRGLA